MANSAGMIKESIWRDPQFRALSRDAQATYVQLVSQKELDRAGMQPLQVLKWAKGCDAITADDILRDLKELEAARFVFVDDDTDELFVRSYMRHGGVLKQPNVFKNALRCASLVASQRLRHELATELRALRRTDANAVAEEIDPGGSTEPHANPTTTLHEHNRNPSGTLPEGLNPSGTLPEGLNPSGTLPEGLNPSGTPLEPRGLGLGKGKGYSLVTNSVGEGDAHDTAPTDDQQTPTPINPWCEQHPGGTDRPCRACGTARQRFDTHATESASTAAAARATAIANCHHCDEIGWRLDDHGLPIEPLIRCTHTDFQEHTP